jgi:hypothetical protein
MCCFVIFTDLNFINNYFNVFQNIGFHWSTLSLITKMSQEIQTEQNFTGPKKYQAFPAVVACNQGLPIFHFSF